MIKGVLLMAISDNKWVGNKNIQPLIRIMPELEVSAHIEAFEKLSGLDRDQFAANNWGFPIIPIPEVKQQYKHTRMAPRNVTKSYLGHPIYWIDPSLTERKQNEGEQEWCIRMFYLIDAMGYWNEMVEFNDYLKINGFSFSDVAIETYHRIADDSESDRYGLLDEISMDVSFEEMEEKYNEAILMCFEIQQEESIKLLQNQAKEYSFAQRVLGENIKTDWTISYSDEGSPWDIRFASELVDIAITYNERAKEDNVITSDLLKRARILQDDLEKYIQRYNHCSSILELPVIAAVPDAPGGAARMSYIASAMEISNTKDNLRLTVLKDIEKKVTESLSRGNTGEGGFDDALRAFAEAYSQTWNRLKLAYINYDRYREGLEPYTNITELNATISGDQQGDSLEEILLRDMQ